MTPERSPLARLIAPRSIVFIGGLEAETAIRVNRQLGFPGAVYAVNPRRDSLAGIACLKSIAELPETPDAAFVAVKREPTIEVVAELARRGVGGAVVYASGFAEVGGRGVYAGPARIREFLLLHGAESPQPKRLFDHMQLQPIVHEARLEAQAASRTDMSSASLDSRVNACAALFRAWRYALTAPSTTSGDAPRPVQYECRRHGVGGDAAAEGELHGVPVFLETSRRPARPPAVRRSG